MTKTTQQTTSKKRYFFGWENTKWVIKELVKMYSNQPSFFSYKRFQMGTAYFMFTQGSMYVLTNFVKSVQDFTLWAIPVLLVSGYTLNAVQKEKITDKLTDEGG